MKNLKMGALFLAIALVVSAIGSAALSTITFDRSLNAGTVLTDIDANVAVKFTNTSGYPALMTDNADGSVSLNLNALINGASTAGFNTNGQYTLGSAANGVFQITNNSDIDIDVSLVNASTGLSLVAATGSTATIASGETNDFFFTLDTDAHNAATNLTGTLRIVENP